MVGTATARRWREACDGQSHGNGGATVVTVAVEQSRDSRRRERLAPGRGVAAWWHTEVDERPGGTSGKWVGDTTVTMSYMMTSVTLTHDKTAHAATSPAVI